jgi:hypothetical protein
MSAPIQATVHAPTAPLWQRVVAYGLGWLLIFAGLIALNSFPIANTLLGMGAWIVVMAPFLMRRRNTKSAQIYVSPGQIYIRASRSFPRTIMTRSLRGAALEQTKGKTTLWLAESFSLNTPITIESDERGLKDMRKALGIRRGGFGEIRKWPNNDERQEVEVGMRAVIGVLLTLWALANLVAPHHDFGAPILVAIFIGSLTASAFIFTRRAPLVKLEQESTSDLIDDDTGYIDQLKRGNASVTDWLARVDAMAATQNEPGYRGAHFSQEDLWRAVENHETAPDVRAAAARLLIRIFPEKSHDRVAAALDSIHSDTERAHLRAALDSDLEVAAREIELLDSKLIDRR